MLPSVVVSEELLLSDDDDDEDERDDEAVDNDAVSDELSSGAEARAAALTRPDTLPPLYEGFLDSCLFDGFCWAASSGLGMFESCGCVLAIAELFMSSTSIT